ncbi:MFS transporter [Streptacidiphilus sp. EB129]|uniref:MFS transporter n=1 Tax=Streptacidiphilus sp. EB129 TaxID=3156262 RepID=UPI003514956D
MLDLAGLRLPVVSFLARLPAAVCPTGTLLLVTTRSGIGAAGIVAGALWAGQAVGGPLIGRIADRRGQRRVVLVAAVVNAALLAALVVTALARQPLAAQAVCAALAGCTVPQVGPLTRSRWVALADGHPHGRELVGRALSLDAVLDEVSFVAGPALAGILAFAVDPAGGLVLSAVLIAVFGVLFALHPSAPTPTRATAPALTLRRSAAGGPRLLSPALCVLITLTVLQGLFFGSANAGVNALAAGDSGVAGLVWSVLGATSAVSGILTGALFGGTSLTLRLRLALLAQSVLVLPLLAVTSALPATLTLAGMGLAVAPNLISIFGLAERAAPVDRMGEAMTLLASGLIIGQGIGALAAGQLAATHGCTAAFALTAVAAALALVTSLTLSGPLRRLTR